MLKKLSIGFDPLDNLSCYLEDGCCFVANSVSELFSHYRTCHYKDDSFSSPCLFSKQCPHTASFKSFSGLYSHIRNYHPSFFDFSSSLQRTNEECQPKNLNSNNDVYNNEFADHVLNDSFSLSSEKISSLHFSNATNEKTNSETELSEKLDLKQCSAEFILGILGNEKIAQTHVESILPKIEKLVDTVVDEVHNQISAVCPVPIDAVNVPKLFEGLRTKRGQLPYFKTKFGLVLPKEINLPMNHNLDFGRHKQGRDQYFRQQKYQYISLLEQLEQILKVDDIYHEIYEKPIEEEIPGQYSSFRHGSKFKKCDLFKKHPRALQINLYLDEVQMCNALGSKSVDKRKFLFVYFSIGNLDMKHRSGLHSIYLLSIFTSEQVTQFGINKLLRPIVEDLKKLEVGVQIKTKETFSGAIFGTLVVIIADNLASHQLGGFKCGFAKSFRKCRTCLATDTEIQTNFCDASFIKRTIEEHNEWCKLLNIPGLQAHFSKLYGINHESIFNELQYFHVVGGLAPDVMHDILEGVLLLIIGGMLKFFVLERKIVKLNDLNHWIQNFDYGPNEMKNKPSVIQLQRLKSNKLRQSSSQLWLLAVTLPLILANKVVRNCTRWTSFTDLLEICRIVFSDQITILQCFQLKELIQTFLTKVKKMKMRITPKMHNLVHYPYYIRLLGPLKNYWAMRFESKHAFFKKTIRVTNFNFINAPATLAERHQLWLTNRIRESKGNLLKGRIETAAPRNGKQVKLRSLSYGGQVCEILMSSNMNYSINLISWISSNANKIVVNKSILLCPLQGSPRYKFGKVVKILLCERAILLACRLYRTESFSDKYQAFSVSLTEKIIVYDYATLNETSTYYVHKPMFDSRPTSCSLIICKQHLQKMLINQN